MIVQWHDNTTYYVDAHFKVHTGEFILALHETLEIKEF